MRYRGKLYRALNPVHAREPLSGQGAALYGGRFNPKGVPALYTSLSILTAIREANQVGDLQPTTLVCYDADIAAVLDGCDPQVLHSVGMTPADLADSTWRDQMRNKGEARTQALARRLMSEGYHGLRVPSFARGARPEDVNLVLWAWGAAPHQLILVDDEGRLTR
ncbi:RES family NAD+ phosphorylase [Aquabacter cavernae]|uniref:RES family NAD+ phosphorylase n=1 Tax=Aquabacter cavernae TaxID=2496029 RepID=UPI000F8E9AE9|nr:RES domain-containing protein [Aquabacter cavernae]